MPLPIFENITEDDLLTLVRDSTLELRTLEYKRELPPNTEEGKKEFLADVASFANCVGGLIIIGIREDANHVPISLDGIENDNPDELVRGLEGRIRDGIQPRIPYFHLRSIALRDGKYAILIHIPKSWLAPHIVTISKSSRFYSRASNGKYQMDHLQIKSAFILSESRSQQIRDFVQSRISDIYSGSAHIPIFNSPLLTVHVIPMSAFDALFVENFDCLPTLPVAPSEWGGFSYAFNADGFIVYRPNVYQPSRGYVQVYRNGIIETVSAISLDHITPPNALPIQNIENTLINAIMTSTNLLRLLRVEPPAYIFITLLKTKGLIRPEIRGDALERGMPIQKDVISLPNFEISRFEAVGDVEGLTSLTRSIKPSFDALANSVGLPRSPSYANDGEWTRR